MDGVGDVRGRSSKDSAESYASPEPGAGLNTALASSTSPVAEPDEEASPYHVRVQSDDGRRQEHGEGMDEQEDGGEDEDWLMSSGDELELEARHHVEQQRQPEPQRTKHHYRLDSYATSDLADSHVDGDGDRSAAERMPSAQRTALREGSQDDDSHSSPSSSWLLNQRSTTTAMTETTATATTAATSLGTSSRSPSPSDSPNRHREWRRSSGPLWSVPLAAVQAGRAHPRASATTSRRLPTMGERDLNKMESQFEDAGYREGITAGKLSTLQAGFDEGFSTVGAPLGRAVGKLRGEAVSLCAYISRLAAQAGVELGNAGPSSSGGDEVSKHGDEASKTREHIDLEYEGGHVGAPAPRSKTVHDAPQDKENERENTAPFFAQEDLLPGPGRARVRLKPLVGHSSRRSRLVASHAVDRHLSQTTLSQQGQIKPADLKTLAAEAHSLLLDTRGLSLAMLAPPDDEALAHEREHVLSLSPEAVSGPEREAAAVWTPESDEARRRREAILPALEGRLRGIKTRLGLA